MNRAILFFIFDHYSVVAEICTALLLSSLRRKAPSYMCDNCEFLHVAKMLVETVIIVLSCALLYGFSLCGVTGVEARVNVCVCVCR